MSRIPSLLALATLLAAPLVLPTAAAGPCDNQLEEILCLVVDTVNGNVEAIREGIAFFCDHWLHGCEVGNTLLP